MTDKPEIKVGQRWVTQSGAIVLILATGIAGDRPVVGQFEADNEVGTWMADGEYLPHDTWRLVSLAPQTVKREVALYRCDDQVLVYEASDWPDNRPTEFRISEPVTIEFTLLPGESA